MDGKIRGTAGTDHLFAEKRDRAFTLIEMIIVVAVIGIMTSLVIAAITNSTADARRVIARQQQATVQEALNSWVASMSLSDARTAYSGASDAAKITNLIRPYLDTNARWFSSLTFTNNIQSENMRSVGVSMVFGAWTTNNYPVVQLLE